jgi:hypothetical protein
LEFDDYGRLLLLMLERTNAGWRWGLHHLGESSIPAALHQADSNWQPFDVALPAHARHFLVRERTRDGATQLIHVYGTLSGREDHQLAALSAAGWYDPHFDPTGRFFSYATGLVRRQDHVASLSDCQEVCKTDMFCLAIGPQRELLLGKGWLVPDYRNPNHKFDLVGFLKVDAPSPYRLNDGAHPQILAAIADQIALLDAVSKRSPRADEAKGTPASLSPAVSN